MSLYIRRSPSPASTQGPPASSRRPIAKLQAKKRSEGSGITGFDFLFAMYGNARFPTQFLDPVIATPDECGGALRYCDALRLRGVLCKDTHDHTIRVSPPLVITRDEIDWALDQFEAALTYREVAAPARPNASSRPARRLRSADLCLHVGKRGVSSTRGANGNLPQRQFYYFCAAADFTLIWSPAALATVQPFYPLQFFWSRFYRPSLGADARHRDRATKRTPQLAHHALQRVGGSLYEPERRVATRRKTIAVNIAKLPELLRK